MYKHMVRPWASGYLYFWSLDHSLPEYFHVQQFVAQLMTVNCNVKDMK
jgi:hypothetical protein